MNGSWFNLSMLAYPTSCFCMHLLWNYFGIIPTLCMEMWSLNWKIFLLFGYMAFWETQPPNYFRRQYSALQFGTFWGHNMHLPVQQDNFHVIYFNNFISILFPVYVCFLCIFSLWPDKVSLTLQDLIQSLFSSLNLVILH